ncbi:hypothetical protein Tco_0067280 [Tanacetum coccineum]
MEKEVAELKKNDPPNTQVTTLVDEHLDSRIGATRDEFMSYLSASITARITEQVKSHLPQILPKEVSNFDPPMIKSMVTKSLEHAVLAKESSQPKYTYEATSSLTKFELNNILIDKMDENKDEDPSTGSDRGLKKRKTSKDTEPTKGPKTKESMFGSSKGTKSQSKSFGKYVQSEEPKFEPSDSPEDPKDPNWNVSKTPRQGPTQSWLMTLASSIDKQLKTFDELMITLIDFSAHIMNGLKITNLTQETLLEPAFKLLKGTRTNYAELEYDFEEFDYFFNNDLKYLQGGISTMTYTTSITKTKAAQYDLPGIEDMTFYGYARGLESTHDVYSTKHILAVTRVNVMRKHGYGYLREIEVRRADNDLYTFKEGHFPRLRINDIKDMLILIVQNKFTNLSCDDVSDFAIALRMFIKSIVIQKRVEDLQLGVKSYQKKINVTKPETTRPDIRKKDPYTPYQDPQGFIYADTQGRNRMEYLPHRRWSSLEKKRAHIIIKATDKQLKERRMMRSFEKFVGGRHYKTDLWLLQRTI